MQSGNGDVLVAEAVAAAVREGRHGSPVEAARVRGMVSDVLGAEVRTRRAEVDAVVVAAEEGIADELAAEHIDRDGAIARLRSRGLDETIAAFAVDVWTYAMGRRDPSLPTPSLTRTDETPDAHAALDDGELGHATVVPDPAAAPPPPPPPPPGGGAPPPVPQLVGAGAAVVTPEPAGRGKRLAVVLSGVAAVLVAIALVATLVLADDGDSSSSTKVRTDDRARTSARISFDAVDTPLGRVTRSWSATGRTVVAAVTITNDTDAASSGRHLEVIPKEMAASAAAITSKPEHIVVEDDPVLGWDLTVPAHGSVTLTSRIGTTATDTIDGEQLGAWKTAREQALPAVEERAAKVPTVAVTTPTPGQVLGATELDVSGTVDPGSTVRVGDTGVPVADDGTWTHHASGLVPGANTLTVTVASPYGAVNRVEVPVVVFMPPTPTPTTTQVPVTATTTTVKGTKRTTTTVGRPPATTVAPPPATTTTQAAPVNRAPTKKFDPTYSATHIQGCNLLDTWYVYVTQAFTDPDGDTLTVTSASASTGSASPKSYNGQSTVYFVEPYPTFSGKVTVNFSVSDGRGGTNSGVLTITVQPTPIQC